MLHHIQHQQSRRALTIGRMLEHLHTLVRGAQGCAVCGFGRSKILQSVTASRRAQTGLQIFGHSTCIKPIATFCGHALENRRLARRGKELSKFRCGTSD